MKNKYFKLKADNPQHCGLLSLYTWSIFGLTHTETSVLDRSHRRPHICIINKSVMTERYSHWPLERHPATEYSSMGATQASVPPEEKK